MRCFLKIIAILILSLLMSACASTGKNHQQTYVSVAIPVNLKHKNKVLKLLLAQHDEWQGTPYEYGGTSLYGVDCSGFIFRTFKDKLGLVLPRTTAEQAKLGQSVARSKLKAGDLVFFKTAKKVRHVGIYTENNQFIHASSSKGVMISSLDNSYWSPRFWMARRL